MKLKFGFVATLAALLMLSAAASAQDRRDVKIADEVGRALTGYARLTIFDDINA